MNKTKNENFSIEELMGEKELQTYEYSNLYTKLDRSKKIITKNIDIIVKKSEKKFIMEAKYYENIIENIDKLENFIIK